MSYDASTSFSVKKFLQPAIIFVKLASGINIFAIAFDQVTELFEHSLYQWRRRDTSGVQIFVSID